MKKRLTAENVHTLKCPKDRKQLLFNDTEVKGFGLLVQRSGHRSFVFSSKHPRVTIRTTDFEKAVVQARRYRDGVLAGKSPKEVDAEDAEAAAKAAAESRTVREIFELYQTRDGLAETTRSKFTERNARAFLDEYGDRQFDELGRDDVAKFLSGLRETPAAAKQLASCVRDSYAYAMFVGVAGGGIPAGAVNPGRGVIRYLDLRAPKSYAYAFTNETQEKFIAALREAETLPPGHPLRISPIALLCIELIVLTGARRDEIRSVRLDQINYDRRFIVRADHKTGRKTGEDREIPLSDAALAVIAKAKAIRLEPGRWGAAHPDNPFLFPSPEGKMTMSHLSDVGKPLKYLSKLAGLDRHLIPHNLRSAHINLALRAGAPLQDVSKAVGHRDVKTTNRHYLKVLDDAKLAAADAVGASFTK